MVRYAWKWFDEAFRNPSNHLELKSGISRVIIADSLHMASTRIGKCLARQILNSGRGKTHFRKCGFVAVTRNQIATLLAHIIIAAAVAV